MINRFDGAYRFLSNFYLSPIEFEGLIYPSGEHLFQSFKTTDQNIRKAIRLAQTPNKAKKLGRQLKLRDNWEETKESYMFGTIDLKFAQNENLAKKLISTNEQELIEGNYWHDNIWGNCECSKCSNIEGKNLLGKILIEIRNEL